MSVSALDVARAALMEVGADPRVLYAVTGYDGRPALRCSIKDASPAVDKAMLLAILATSGPDYRIWCSTCAWEHDNSLPPCTPVRDVLRGVTCGRVPS